MLRREKAAFSGRRGEVKDSSVTAGAYYEALLAGTNTIFMTDCQRFPKP